MTFATPAEKMFNVQNNMQNADAGKASGANIADGARDSENAGSISILILICALFVGWELNNML